MDASHPHADVSTTSRILTGLAIGSALVGGAVILAPHILPALGIGDVQVAADAMQVMHTAQATPNLPLTHEFYLPITHAGSGLAGIINRGMANYVPFIGEHLAEGGMFNMLATATTGIGGVMLGRYLTDEGDKNSLQWGKIIQYAALATSALIALPTLLTGISMGLSYLSMVYDGGTYSDTVIEKMFYYVGISGASMDNMMMGASGAAAAIPHFLTCGISILPAMVGLQMWQADHQTKSEDAPHVAITLPDHLAPNVPTTARVKLSHANGKPLTVEELKVVHTEKVHLFIADESLNDYHHVHPRPTGVPGEFTVPFTPHSANNYQAWVELTPLGGKEHIVKAEIEQPKRPHVPTTITINNMAKHDDLKIVWEPTEPLIAGKDAMIRVNITKDGKPITDLEPLLGAYAHLAGFSGDGSAMVHCHPLGEEPKKASDRGTGELMFHITPKSAGPTKFYLQFQRGGEEIFVPFGQMVAPPTKHAERVQTQRHAHNTAMGY